MSLELSEQEQLRRRSLAALRELGIEPYPAAMFDVTATAAQITQGLTADNAADFADVRIAGRIMSRRIMGSASFFELQDHTGYRYISAATTSAPRVTPRSTTPSSRSCST